MAKFVPSLCSETNPVLAVGDIFLFSKQQAHIPALYCIMDDNPFALIFPDKNKKESSFIYWQFTDFQALKFEHQPYIDWSESAQSLDLDNPRDIQNGELVVLKNGLRITLTLYNENYYIDPVTGHASKETLRNYVGIAKKWRLILPLVLDGTKIGEQILAQSA